MFTNSDRVYSMRCDAMRCGNVEERSENDGSHLTLPHKIKQEIN